MHDTHSGWDIISAGSGCDRRGRRLPPDNIAALPNVMCNTDTRAAALAILIAAALASPPAARCAALPLLKGYGTVVQHGAVTNLDLQRLRGVRQVAGHPI